MSHAFLFGQKIKFVITVCRYFDRNPLFDLHAEIGKLVNLIRVICQQAERLHAEILQDLRPDIIFPHILGKSEREICLHRIHSFALQFVCF